MILIFTTILLFSQTGLSHDKRCRGDGVFNVLSSNTAGLGNIFFQGGGGLYFQTKSIPTEDIYSMAPPEFQRDIKMLAGDKEQFFKRDFFIMPELHGIVGLTSFMHLEANSTPWTGEKLGPTTVRIKLTLPGNDNLRTVGFGVSANVSLATEENTVNSQEETPTFEPIISVTGILDVDLIKKYPDFPAKFYLNYSNLDNHRLSPIYTQHSVAMAFEWKRWAESWYIKSSFALYRRKPVVDQFLLNKPRSAFICDLGLGYLKRFTRVIPFSLSFGIIFNPLGPMRFLKSELHRSPSMSVSMQIPIYFKETNAEAIRSLIFLEQARKSGKNKIAENSVKIKRASEMTLDTIKQQNGRNNLFIDEQIQLFLEKEEKENRIKKRRKIYRDFAEESRTAKDSGE